MHESLILCRVDAARQEAPAQPLLYGNEHDLGVMHCMQLTLALPSAAELIEVEVKALAAAFPELGLSFGYIGNCDMGPYARWDDRSWRVFTNRCGEDGRSCSWGYAHTDTLDHMLDVIREGRLARWCDVVATFPRRH
jgi:hypothetical protein